MDLQSLDSLCFYWEKVASNTDALYLMEAQKNLHLAKINGSLQDALVYEKRKSRRTNIGVGVGGTLLGVVLGVLLLN